MRQVLDCCARKFRDVLSTFHGNKRLLLTINSFRSNASDSTVCFVNKVWMATRLCKNLLYCKNKKKRKKKENFSFVSNNKGHSTTAHVRLISSCTNLDNHRTRGNANTPSGMAEVNEISRAVNYAKKMNTCTTISLSRAMARYIKC